jgi:hypothetical protein
VWIIGLCPRCIFALVPAVAAILMKLRHDMALTTQVFGLGWAGMVYCMALLLPDF